MASFIHPQAIVDTNNIGSGTRIWAFAHILGQASIGKNCNICDHVFIENDVVIGDEVTVKCGVYLWDGLRVASRVFIGPNVTFTNDLRPRSKQYPAQYLPTIIDEGASIGANATIIAGHAIGRYSLIGAGAVVTQDIPPHTLWYGNPAVFHGYVCTCGEKLNEKLFCSKCKKAYILVEGTLTLVGTNSSYQRGGYYMSIEKCRIIDLPKITDPRGNLSFIEGKRHIPFDIQRVYYLYDIPGGETRGGHAHKDLQQLIVAMSGSFDVIIDDGYNKKTVSLNRSYYGLYLPNMIWRELVNFSSGAVCMVLASNYYNEDDYYRDYDKFIAIIRGM